MNPDLPPTPQEELEARLTALVLGELSADESAALHQRLQQEPDLQALFTRLQQTSAVLREAMATLDGPAADSSPAQLSPERRQKLLQALAPARPASAPLRPKFDVREWAMPLALVAALLLLVGIVLSLQGPFTLSRHSKALSFAQRHWVTAGSESLSEPRDKPTDLARGDRLNGEAENQGRIDHVTDSIALSVQPPPTVESFALDKNAGKAVMDAESSGVSDLKRAPQAQPKSYSALGVVDSTAGRYVLPSLETAQRDGRQSTLGDLSAGSGIRTNSRGQSDGASSRFGGMGGGGGGGGGGGAGGGGGLSGGLGRQQPPGDFDRPINGWMEENGRAAQNRPAEPSPSWRFFSQTPATTAPAAPATPSEDKAAALPFGAIAGGAPSPQGIPPVTPNPEGQVKLQGADRKSGQPAGVSDFFERSEANRARVEIARPAVTAPAPEAPPAPTLNVVESLDAIKLADVSPTPAPAKPPEQQLRQLTTDETRSKFDDTVNGFAKQVKDAAPAQQQPAEKPAGPVVSKDPVALGFEYSAGAKAPLGGTEKGNAQLGKELAKVEAAPKKAELKEKLSELEDEVGLKRAKAAVPSQPEIQTRDNAFSTFSLNVSDVSFQLVAAALETGKLPDPATVRSEEFINAFDYRDPAPAGDAPVAFAWERSRYPFAHNRDVLRFGIKTAEAGRGAGRPLNLVLLLDNSGSMERADRVQIIRECLKVLGSQLHPQDRVSVVSFARTARLWVDALPGAQAGELVTRVGGLTPEGGTNLEEALKLAYQTALRHYMAAGNNRVVLLTDGAANLGEVQPEVLEKAVESHRRQGVALDCFGIGWEGFNDELLATLSHHGDGRYAFVNTPEAAAQNFAGQLAGALQVAAADVKVQVEFNPGRVTAYRQIGYAQHQLTKQQFRDNTVDAAELAAAEAGNALYVTELNPQGEGPIGTVRVRFRDVASGEYRERSWEVPYNGPTAPLEQASPSLRLAAASAAFSEWLAGSPFAAEANPDRLLPLLQGVPEHFGADPRPKKLEWMLRQAKAAAGK